MPFQELQREITINKLTLGPCFCLTARPYQYQRLCKNESNTEII